MKHIRKLTILCLVVLIAAACTPSEAATPFSISVTDALGQEVRLTEKPMRIVSLTLGTDEILLELVGPERLIGVTYLAADATTSNIAEHPDLARVAHTVEATPEQIIALEPDLVLVATFTDQAVLEQLRDAGITVYAVGYFNSIEAMEQNIIDIGQLVGEAEGARAMVADMEARLAKVDEAVSLIGGDKPRVLYLASDSWVAGSATTVDDIIMRAGGINAAADLVDWNQISQEAIIGMDPDVVILSPYVQDDEFLTNPVFAGLTSVQNGRVYSLSDAAMSATSQYIVRGVEELAKVLYPDLSLN